MSRDNQLIIYLDDSEYAQLKEWSQKTGKSMSELGRNAILEYTDKDRLHRIENQIAEMQETLEKVADNRSTHTHKHGAVTKASETVEKTREIADRIYSNHEGQLHTDDLNKAIKDIAGGDERTIEKYHGELKERDFVFEHPNDDAETWYLDRDEFVKVLAQYAKQTNNPEAVAQRIISQEYGFEMGEVFNQMKPIIQ